MIIINKIIEEGRSHVSTRIIANERMVREIYEGSYKKQSHKSVKSLTKNLKTNGTIFTSTSKFNFKDRLIALYTESTNENDRYVIKCEECEVKTDDTNGWALFFKVIDTSTGDEIKICDNELIRTVAQMNAEYRTYKNNLNEFILSKSV